VNGGRRSTVGGDFIGDHAIAAGDLIADVERHLVPGGEATADLDRIA
jgi:hypothetical protein